jgi:hypothetical protein
LLTTDTRLLVFDTWTDLLGEGARADCRRGDDDDPLAGVTRIQLPDGTGIDVVVGRWKWELAAGGILALRDAAASLAIGDREALIHEIESTCQRSAQT